MVESAEILQSRIRCRWLVCSRVSCKSRQTGDWMSGSGRVGSERLLREFVEW